jgi:hypothetical protein
VQRFGAKPASSGLSYSMPHAANLRRAKGMCQSASAWYSKRKLGCVLKCNVPSPIRWKNRRHQDQAV